jgi:hypothetical protein
MRTQANGSATRWRWTAAIVVGCVMLSGCATYSGTQPYSYGYYGRYYGVPYGPTYP